jgi:DNA primase
MIPIHDQRGRIIGFGGRALSPDAKPKYLNSPETPIFHKGSVVFNFHRARQPAHESGSVIAVEGYMDAIAIHQAGLKGVVATMGTAFTEEQIATLWRLSPEPIICFDSDRAGIAAAYKSIDRILPLLVVGRTFRFAFMREGKDPDDLIREKGIEAFKDVLSGSLPMWDVLWEREIANVDLKTPDHQAAIEQKLYALVRTIKDPNVYTAYFRTCRMQLASLFWQMGKGSEKRPAGAQQSKFVQAHVKIPREGYRHGLQKVLLGMLVHYPEFLDDKHEKIERLQFAPGLHEFCDDLYRLLIDEHHLSVRKIYEKLKPNFYEVLQHIHGEETGKHPWGYRLFLRFPILKKDPPLDFISRCIDHFAGILYIHQIDDDIEQARLGAGAPEASDAVMNKLVQLVRQRHLESEEVENTGRNLTEEAETITRVWAPGRGSLQTAP